MFSGLDAETLSQITGTELMGQVSKQSEQKITFFQKLKNFQIRWKNLYYVYSVLFMYWML